MDVNRKWSKKAKFGFIGAFFAVTAVIGAGVGFALTLSGVFAPFGAGIFGMSMFALATASPGLVGVIGTGIGLLANSIRSLFGIKHKKAKTDVQKKLQDEVLSNSCLWRMGNLFDCKKSTYRSPKPNYQKQSSNHQPPADSVAVFEWATFSHLNNFSDESLLPVLERISNDIIERPYHYDKHHVYNVEGKEVKFYKHHNANNLNPPAKISGVAVYKQNHGTGHGLRQLVYTDKLIQALVNKGNNKGKKIAKSILDNQELKSAIKLAAFCKRIGRTMDHESDKNEPSIYTKRSADMFKQMAIELGFNTNLVNIISNSMLEPTPRDKNTMSSYQDIGNISGKDLSNFTSSILMASHMADLVRLSQVKQKYIHNKLSYYLDEENNKAVTKNLVEFACKANEMTGNKVRKQESGIVHKIKNYFDGKKLVQVTKNIGSYIQKLSNMRFDKKNSEDKSEHDSLDNNRVSFCM